MIEMLRRVYKSLTASMEQARAMRQLHSMSDRELSDIGIARAEIDAIVTGQISRPVADPALVRPKLAANRRAAPAPQAALDAA